MSLWTGAIAITQAEDVSLLWGFANPDPLGSGDPALAVPFSFTGSTAKLQIRQGPLSTSPLILALATGGSGLALGGPTLIGATTFGTITATIANSVTANLAPGNWFFDCFVTTATNQASCYMQGSWTIKPSGTR